VTSARAAAKETTLSPNSDEKEISLYTACSHSSNENKGNNHHG